MKLLLLFLLFSNFLFAQNFVKNPGFEELIECNLSYEYFLNVTDWLNVNEDISSIDAFNFCNIDTNGFNYYSIPNSYRGFQYPKSGNGFSGLVYGVYYLTDNRPFLDSTREFATTKLKNKMILNSKYCVSLHTSLVNEVIWQSSQINYQIGVFTNKITIALHSSLLNIQNYEFPNEVDHKLTLTKDNNEFLTDTLGWELVRAPYVSSGDEDYIILGNFFSDTLSNFQLQTIENLDSIINDIGIAIYLYVFFDDVSIIEITQPQIYFSPAEGYPENYIWLIDTTSQEEKQWYKTGDDLLLGTGDSLLILATQGTQFSLYTRNCRVEQSDTLIIDYTGIAPETLRKQISITNNLTNAAFQVSYLGSATIKLQINIYNSIGQLVKSETIPQSSSINVSELISGVYFCEVINNGVVLKREKLVKINN